MATTVEESKVTLSKIPKKKVFSVKYMLKTPNFFTLPEYDGTWYAVNSPSFEFADATWRIEFEPRHTMKTITDENDCMKRFAVNMVRLSSEISHHAIFYQITLLDADDKPYREFNDANIYYRNLDPILTWVFENKNPSYDRRDTLTLTIQLFCVESVLVDDDQNSLTANRGKQILNVLLFWMPSHTTLFRETLKRAL